VPPLEAWGWSPVWEERFAAFAGDGRQPGRVLREDRRQMLVAVAAGDCEAHVAGRLIHTATAREAWPAVGDWVALARAEQGRGARIEAVLPRTSRFVRRAVADGNRTEEQVLAANVDTIFLVAGLNEDFNPRRLERYLTAAWDSGARPVVLLNKADLCDDIEAAIDAISAAAVGVPIHSLSAATGAGLEALAPYLGRGQTVVFLGSSGVGKSTLINRLLGEARQAVREIRAYDGRGRHTTTAREMLALPEGGLVIDTPGLRELELWDDGEGVDHVFADIAALAEECRFRDCQHGSEPGCAVLAAVAAGELDPRRLESFHKLQREQAMLAIRKEQRARLGYGTTKYSMKRLRRYRR